MFLASEGSYFSELFYLISDSAYVVPCGRRKKSAVHHYTADYIFWSFGMIEFILSFLENRKLLKPVVGVWSVLHISLLVTSIMVCYFLFFGVFLASKRSNFSELQFVLPRIIWTSRTLLGNMT